MTSLGAQQDARRKRESEVSFVYCQLDGDTNPVRISSAGSRLDLKWTRLAPDSVKINGVINMVAEDGSTIDTVADLQQQMNRLGRPTGADEGHPLVLVGSPLPPGASTTPTVPELIPRAFVTSDVVNPKHHYYQEPPELPEVMTMLTAMQQRFVVICTGRQTGKSTLMHALRRKLLDAGYKVLLMELGTVTQLAFKDSRSFWQHMHHVLDLASEKAGRSSPWRAESRFEKHPSALTWVTAVTNNGEDGPPEWLLLDEASAIPPRFMGEFIVAAGGIKNTPSSLRGVVVFGVHTLKMAIAGLSEIDSIPPFKDDATRGMQPFSEDDIFQLLVSAIKERLSIRPGNLILPTEHAHQVARSIMQLTAGVKGLSGYCLAQLVDPTNPIGSSDDWERYCGSELVEALVASSVFKKIAQKLHEVFPSRSVEIGLRTARGSTWDRLQLQQELLTNVAHQGQCTIPASSLDAVLGLIAEGLLAVSPAGQHIRQRGGWDLSNLDNEILGNSEVPLVITFAAPLLGVCMLRRLTLSAQVAISMPESAELDIMWLLQQVLRNLDLSCLLAVEGSLVAGIASEYSWQAQAYLLCYTLLKQTPQFVEYRVVGEARSYVSSNQTRRRMDVLMFAENKQSYGMELLVAGTKSTLDDHVARAQLYSKLHASQVAGHAKNCQVYVVNFVEAADDPEYLGANFSRFYTPTCDSQDVSTVHVVLSREKREAKILTSAGCITVHIDRDTVDGRPRILFRRRSATD